MAGNRIKGITIEIGGNTTKLTDSLKNVDKSLKDTQTKLKDVNKLLKLDPSNVELLRQKQDLLKQAVADTKTRQEELKKALDDAKNSGSTQYTQEQQDALQRELIETTQQLENYQKALNESNPTLEAISAKTGEWSQKTKGMSMAAGAGAAALVGMATSAASSADDLATLARNTGLSVEELQKMKYASDFIDVSMEAMTGSITKLTKNMASGSKTFETLGVSITDADGNMRDATDVWYDSLEALSKVQNETERDALSMELFGKSAMELSGIVDDGGASLRELGQQAEDTGLILSEDAVNSAVLFNDQIDKLKNTATQAFFSAGSSLATTLVPALEKLVNIVVSVLSWFGKLDGSTQAFILTVLGLVAAISPVLGLISAVTGAAAALNVAMLPMIATVGGIILAMSGALLTAMLTGSLMTLPALIAMMGAPVGIAAAIGLIGGAICTYLFGYSDDMNQ
jgi:DNA-binding transcriptional MerR regulator